MLPGPEPRPFDSGLRNCASVFVRDRMDCKKQSNWRNVGIMQAVILARGYGTRISRESHLRPKPLIETGGKPILWHIIKLSAAHGISVFVICLGYRRDMTKECQPSM